MGRRDSLLGVVGRAIPSVKTEATVWGCMDRGVLVLAAKLSSRIRPKATKTFRLSWVWFVDWCDQSTRERAWKGLHPNASARV